MRVPGVLLPVLLLMASPAPATIRIINIQDVSPGVYRFSPASLFITRGDTVRWVNQSLSTHTATSGYTPLANGLFDSGTLAHNATFQRVFNAMGRFPYFCGVHNEMTGEVRVTKTLITIKSFAYSPHRSAIAVGDTVLWKNNDGFTHTATSGVSSPSGVFNTGLIGAGATGQAVMTLAGNIPYHCEIHSATATMHDTLVVSGPAGLDEARTSAARLLAARPNPTSGQVDLGFVLATGSRVRLRVMDASGREVRELLSETLPAGRHSVSWDGRTRDGLPAATGVYYYRLDLPQGALARRLTLIR